MNAAVWTEKLTLFSPAAGECGRFFDWTKTFINSSQTKICCLPKRPGQWANFAAAVQIRYDFIDSRGLKWTLCSEENTID